MLKTSSTVDWDPSLGENPFRLVGKSFVRSAESNQPNSPVCLADEVKVAREELGNEG